VLLPSLVDRVRSDFHLCVFHSFTLSLASGKPRERLESLLAKVSEKRNLFQISLEWAKSSEAPLLILATFIRGAKTEKLLAKSQPHGEWLEWLLDS
jgi:hypothetical protein